MSDKEEISKLRDKLRQNRKTYSQTAIESRLYGSPEDDGQGEEKPAENTAGRSVSNDDGAPAKDPEAGRNESELPEEEYLNESLIERNKWTDNREDGQENKNEEYPDRAAEAGQPVENKPPEAEETPEKTRKPKLFTKKYRQKRPKRPKKPKKYTKLTALKENILLIPKYILVPAVVLLLLFAVLIWYVSTDASDLKEINISGNEIITDDEIESRLDFAAGDKMFSIDPGTAEENISLLPIIVDVNVERDWWNGVTVSISEHQVVGYIENEGGYNPVLENRRVLRGYQVSPVNGPLIYFFEGEEMDGLVDNLNDIEPEIRAGISEIYFRPTDNSLGRIHLLMNDGQEIVADYRDFGEKMNHYIGMKEEIGDDTEGIIDIEIGSSFLPYDSNEARQIKNGIYNSPEAAGYVNELNTSLNSVKDTLNQFEEFEEE